ncbi:hypothetical protein [Nocardioides pacificus]
MTSALPIPVQPARLAAALVLAVVAVCWPAPALADTELDLPGESVETSTDLGAPADITVGTWRFDVGSPDEGRWFRLRREIPGSTVHAAVVGPAEEGDGLALEISTPDEASCARESGSVYAWGRLMGVRAIVGPDVDPVAASEEDEEDPCLASETLLVRVARSSLAEGDGDLPVTLRLVEEAPVKTLEGLPVHEEDTDFRAPDVSGEASETEAAAGLAAVPEIETGIHRGTVRTGELAVQRISLDWGQYALVRLISPKLSESVAEDFEDGLPGLKLAVRDPLLGPAGATDRPLLTSGVTTLEQVVGPVRYLRRGDTSPGPHLPGDYHLVVEAEGVGGEGLDVDYTLQVEIVGDPDGVPDYAEGEPFVLAEGETARLVSYDGGGGLLRLLAAGVLGVLGAGSLGAGVVLLRRR